MHARPTTLVPAFVELFITYIALFTVEYAYYFCNHTVRDKTGIFSDIIDDRNDCDGTNNVAFMPWGAVLFLT